MHRSCSVSLGALLLILGVGPTAVRAQSADEAEIRRLITTNYLEGRRQADSTLLNQGFDTAHAHMLFVRSDSLIDVPIPTYISRVASARKEPGWKVGPPSPARITLVDITGTAAVAKIEDRGPEQVVVDYMLLLKTGGRWQIVGKSFDRTPIKR